jgi:hypothetical protein
VKTIELAPAEIVRIAVGLSVAAISADCTS